MYVLWKKRRLSASRRGPTCTHAGANRFSWRPFVVRHTKGAPGDYTIVAALPALKSCCRRIAEVRRAWWSKTDAVLERLRQAGPDRNRGRDVDVEARAHLRNIDAIRKVLESKIPRPRNVVTRAVTREAVRQAREADQAIVAAKMVTSSCWDVVGAPPGSNYRMLKEAARQRKNQLDWEHAPISSYFEVDEALRECWSRLESGQW
jgi:hypothetical protein